MNPDWWPELSAPGSGNTGDAQRDALCERVHLRGSAARTAQVPGSASCDPCRSLQPKRNSEVPGRSSRPRSRLPPDSAQWWSHRQSSGQETSLRILWLASGSLGNPEDQVPRSVAQAPFKPVGVPHVAACENLRLRLTERCAPECPPLSADTPWVKPCNTQCKGDTYQPYGC